MKYRIKDTDLDYENENSNKIYKKKSKNRRNTETNKTQDISNNNYYKINNTTSSKTKTKNDFEEDNTNPIYDFEGILNSIKNEENKDFIDEYKNNIIQVLIDLNKEDLKLFLNSKNILKKLIKKMKNGIIKKEKNN